MIQSPQSVAFIHSELLRYRLEKPVGGSGVAMVDVLVTTARLSGGASGLGFSYVIGGGGEVALGAARQLGERVLNQPLHHPEALWHRLAGSLNRTRRGPNFIALAAIDVACWDAYANDLSVPLGIAMGGAPRAVKVYGSGGFTPGQSPEAAAATACEHVACGFLGVKPRASGTRGDEALISAVASVLPTSVELMLDANEKCSASSAQRLLALAREAGVLFVEEPLTADDATGYRTLAKAYPNLVASGEHLQGAVEMLPFLTERLVGVLQPDLAMVGGLTESLLIARMAAALGVEIAPHFLPGLFVHLAAAAPKLAWLEDFPLIEPLFSGWPLMNAHGMLAMRDVAGHGLRLADGAREQFLLDA